LLAHAEQQLDTHLQTIATEAHVTTEDIVDRRGSVARALDRLDKLRGALAQLASAEVVAPSPEQAERRLRDHDAQLGATLLAGLATALAIPVLLWAHRLGQIQATRLLALMFAFDMLLLLYLVKTRRRPSARRALWATLVFFTLTLLVVTYNQLWLIEMNRPYAVFLGQKLLMVSLGLSLATRFKLGIVLIAVTAADALALWFLLDLGARRDVVALSEPSTTLIFMYVGIASLRMLEQRLIVSIRLLRAESEASAMHRRALMFLALRDRLNSPLQTLVLGTTTATSQLSDAGARRVHTAIEQLVDFSHELAKIDLGVPRTSTSFDADRELRRRA
jgi:hypothetical protein